MVADTKQYRPNPKKLWKAVESSRLELQDFREMRKLALEEYAGANYSEEVKTKVPVGLLEMAIITYLSILAARAPKVFVRPLSPRTAAKTQQADKLEQVVPEIIEEVDLETTLSGAVMDALFRIGIIRVGREPMGALEDSGETFYAHETYAERVDLNDFVVDMRATDLKRAAFIGHRNSIPHHRLEQMDVFSKKQLAEMTPDDGDQRNAGGDMGPHSLSQGEAPLDDEYYHYVKLWEIFVPETQMVYVFHEDSGKQVREYEWDYPLHGPYHLLGFGVLPDNLMPKAPIDRLLDLHRSFNAAQEKLDNQADREKMGLAYSGGAADDAERIKDFADGDAFQVDNLEEVKEMKIHGIDNILAAYAMQVKGLFSDLVGNLDALAGLGPQSGTVGQDEMIHASANRLVTPMQHSVVRLAKSVIEHIAYYEYMDPMRERAISRNVSTFAPGLDIPFESPTGWRPSERELTEFRFGFDIQPYSMEDQTPQVRLQRLIQVVQQVMMPIMPFAKGLGFDAAKLAAIIEDYTGLNELKDIFVFDSQDEEEAKPEERQRQSPVTTRTQVRENRPGATRGGRDAQYIQNMLGAAKQN